VLHFSIPRFTIGIEKCSQLMHVVIEKGRIMSSTRPNALMCEKG
jgi:hypothetical protein